MWHYNETIFYHIYPLGFCGAPYNNEDEKVENRLLKIIDWIPHMKDLGINALYLGPVFKSLSHGYDTVDYYKVDNRLGTMDILIKVIRELKQNGIKVVLDGVFNHVSREFFAVKDVVNNKEQSKYKDWIYGIDFSQKNSLNDPFVYYGWGGDINLVKLNYRNDEVRKYVLDVVTYWINTFDIDGIRLDAADCLDFEFMRELSKVTKNIKDDFWLLGEVIDGIEGSYRRWLDEAKLDSVTNYECYKGLYSSLNDRNYHEIAYSLNRLFGPEGLYKYDLMYNFVDNHDVDRIASTLNDYAHLYPLYILLFTIPGIPSIYYGSEWGVQGKRDHYREEAIRPDLNLKYLYNNGNMDLLRAIKKIISLRENNRCLMYGEYTQLFVSSEQFLFKRIYKNEEIVIALNASGYPKEVHLDEVNGKYYDLLNEEHVEINNNLYLHPNWGRILTLKK